jgi:hypothetical protein
MAKVLQHMFVFMVHHIWTLSLKAESAERKLHRTSNDALKAASPARPAVPSVWPQHALLDSRAGGARREPTPEPPASAPASAPTSMGSPTSGLPAHR